MTLDGLVKVSAGEVDCAHVSHLPRLKDLVADLLPHELEALREERGVSGQNQGLGHSDHSVARSLGLKIASLKV